MTMCSGTTVGEARATFASVFPGLSLLLWDGSTAFYKEGGYPEYQVADSAIVPHRPGRSCVVELAGTMTAAEVRDAIYVAFGWEAEVHGLNEPSKSLDVNVPSA